MAATGRRPDQLSYPMDRTILRRFVQIPPDTTTVLLVRHAKAGSRKKYEGDDDTRPLDEKGRVQAEALVGQLRAFGASEVSSADRTRCVQTVEPLAASLEVPIHTSSPFSPKSSTRPIRRAPAPAPARSLLEAAFRSSAARAGSSPTSWSGGPTRRHHAAACPKP